MGKEVVIVTGSSGRIGYRVAERFAKHFTVVGFDIVPAAKPIPGVEFIKVDIGSEKSVHDGFKQVRKKFGKHIASIVHLAAYYSFSSGEYTMYKKITVNGTRHMIEEAQSFDVDQFIFSSTMLVHAPCEPDERIDENWPIEGSWAYPQSKIDTEKLLHAKRGKIPTAILRIAGIYDDGCHSIPLSNQIQRIYEKQLESHLFPGDLSHGASFLHMEDLVDCIDILVKKRKQLKGELVLILGEDKTIGYGDLQNEFGKHIHNKKWWTIRVPKWFAKMGAFTMDLLPFFPPSFIKPWMVDIADANYTVDISRAHDTIGWKPKRYLKKVIPKMLEGLKKDPLKWYADNKLTPPSWLIKKYKKGR